MDTTKLCGVRTVFSYVYVAREKWGGGIVLWERKGKKIEEKSKNEVLGGGGVGWNKEQER